MSYFYDYLNDMEKYLYESPKEVTIWYIWK